jgi:hypothetical protein
MSHLESVSLPSAGLGPLVDPAERAPATPRPGAAPAALEASSGLAEASSPEESIPGGDTPALALLERLVRAPAAFAARLEHAEPVALARALLATVVVGAGVFGAVLGAHRGGRQVVYCAAKLPLLLLGTLAVCTPAFVTIARATRTGHSAREVVGLTLAASARAALVLAGLAPVLWLLLGVLSYHGIILATVAGCAVAGAAAGGMLVAGLRQRRRGAAAAAALAFVAVYGIVGAHTAWLLRPFVVRPRTTSVPFLRPIEGDLLDSVGHSLRSAAGIYDRAAPGVRRPRTDLDAPGPSSAEPGRARCESARCE